MADSVTWEVKCVTYYCAATILHIIALLQCYILSRCYKCDIYYTATVLHITALLQCYTYYCAVTVLHIITLLQVLHFITLLQGYMLLHCIIALLHVVVAVYAAHNLAQKYAWWRMRDDWGSGWAEQRDEWWNCTKAHETSIDKRMVYSYRLTCTM